MSEEIHNRKQHFFNRGFTALQELYGSHDQHIQRAVGQFSVGKVFAGSQYYRLAELFGTKEAYSAELAGVLIERATTSVERRKVINEAFSAVSNDESLRSRQAYFDYCALRMAQEDPYLVLRHHLRPYIPTDHEAEVSLGSTLLLTMYTIDPESFVGEMADIVRASVFALATIDTLAVMLQNEQHG